MRDAVLLQGPLIDGIERLMVPLSKLGYSASVFQTRGSSGRLFATGLKLSASPEDSHLLDQFAAYIRSSDFAPHTSMSVSDLRTAIKQNPAADRLTGSSEARFV